METKVIISPSDTKAIAFFNKLDSVKAEIKKSIESSETFKKLKQSK